jgi:hypothetical protein
MNERLDKAIQILQDEWDVCVVLCSRYHNGVIEMCKAQVGNGYAVQQMLEDTMDEIVFGEIEEDEDGEEETEA